MNHYHIDARQRYKLAAVSDRAAMNRTVRPCGEPPSCPHHRSSAQVSKEDAAAVGRTAERGSDSSNAICGTYSWIMTIIHDVDAVESGKGVA
jgi:hypothetical protein